MSDSSAKFPPEFLKFKKIDPFQSIPPALLNSADIFDYAVTTGMIDPFDPKKVKSGSYAISIAGEVHLWKENKQKDVIPLRSPDDSFTLKPNSIAYLFLDTKVFLPDYMAMRFNLKIEHVHKGLLLGTGPLVDPGFAGQLFVPLHNLTTNSYTFGLNDGFIWVEFTKLSPIRGREQKLDLAPRNGEYVQFREDKMFMQPKDYIEQATHGNAVLSSIPEAVSDAKTMAAGARKDASAAGRTVKWLTGLGAIAVAGLFYQSNQLYEQTKGLIQTGISYTTTARSETAEKLNKADQAISRVDKLEKEIRDLKLQLRSVQKESATKR